MNEDNRRLHDEADALAQRVGRSPLLGDLAPSQQPHPAEEVLAFEGVLRRAKLDPGQIHAVTEGMLQFQGALLRKIEQALPSESRPAPELDAALAKAQLGLVTSQLDWIRAESATLANEVARFGRDSKLSVARATSFRDRLRALLSMIEDAEPVDLDNHSVEDAALLEQEADKDLALTEREKLALVLERIDRDLVQLEGKLRDLTERVVHERAYILPRGRDPTPLAGVVQPYSRASFKGRQSKRTAASPY